MAVVETHKAIGVQLKARTVMRPVTAHRVVISQASMRGFRRGQLRGWHVHPEMCR